MLDLTNSIIKYLSFCSVNFLLPHIIFIPIVPWSCSTMTRIETFWRLIYIYSPYLTIFLHISKYLFLFYHSQLYYDVFYHYFPLTNMRKIYCHFRFYPFCLILLAISIDSIRFGSLLKGYCYLLLRSRQTIVYLVTLWRNIFLSKKTS